MKRASKVTSDAYHRSELLFHGTFPYPSPKTSRTLLKPYPQIHTPSRILPTQTAFRFARPLSNLTAPPNTAIQRLIPMFADPRADEFRKVSALKDQILACNGDSQAVVRVLDDQLLHLVRVYPDGSASVELLEQLRSSPPLALQVLNWRRKTADPSLPITSEEYSKGITIAGKAKNVKLATELFEEASNKGIKTASIYNALMAAYMVNGLTRKCESLFRIFKKEVYCNPTIVTYNTLISAFSRLMLVDHMEATLEGIKEAHLTPTLKTCNNLIVGYVIAWKWDAMEKTYNAMKGSSVQPDTRTYLLMLRGYSHSGNLEKMEKMYELAKQSDIGSANDINTVITLICGYCKHSSENRIKRIEELRKLIPEDYYSSWLNVLLIKTYAKEGLVDEMEELIDEAFERQTSVVTPGVMRAIITAFYNCNAVDKLSEFVRRAEWAGWRLCRSLYHCKMVMYAAQNRVMEMEGVLSEMERVNLDRTKKTLVILYNAYLRWGPRYKVYQLQGLMCKRGYEIHPDDCHS